MPGGDRTGPRGEGPMTGRAQGFCAGHDAPGYLNSGWPWGQGFPGQARRRWRFRGGAGSRLRGGFYGPYRESFMGVSERTMIENQIRILKDQVSHLEDQLDRLKSEDQHSKDGP